MLEVTGENAGLAVGGLGALAYFGRLGLSWLKERGLADAKTDANRDVIETLREEAKRWEERYNVEVAAHAANQELLGELRIQNAMLRALLMQRGMSKDELDALIIGARHE